MGDVCDLLIVIILIGIYIMVGFEVVVIINLDFVECVIIELVDFID